MTGQANAQGHTAIGSLGTGLLIWKGDVGKETSHLGTPSPRRNHKVELQGNHKSQSISPQQHFQGVTAACTCHCDLQQLHPLPARLYQHKYCSKDP